MNSKLRLAFLNVLFIAISINAWSISPEELMNIDLDKNYKSYKINELRLIRSMIYARQGYLFTESDLRDYFMTNFNWYDSLVWKNAELGWSGKPVPPIVISEKEQKFVEKIDLLISEKCKENFYSKKSYVLPELENIANRFKEEDFPENIRNILKENGFVIEKDSLEQLFHLYDKNRYTNTPSFVTTDLFLQLFHIYFAYTLQELEKEKLIPLVSDLTEGLYYESLKYLNSSKNEEILKMANFNACFFAIAYTLLTNNKLNVPRSILAHYNNELTKINRAEDYYSVFFNSPVPYSLFTPRGYYTRTEEQKRYFKTMMWLQIAPYCLSNNELLKNACFSAFLLKTGKSKLGRPVKLVYSAVYDPIAFLVGDADNISVSDICDVYEKYKVNNIDWLANQKIIDMVAMKLREIVREKDQIQPKIKLSCQPKINFMPQRYLVDNDILQQFVDITKNADKAFPKSLEIFSVLGVEQANDILYNYYQENKKWKDYDSIMQQQKDKFKNFSNWDQTVYNKWLQCLIKLNRIDKTYPYFMQNQGWKLKNLNTSLASWAELKHDVILYGEQPMAAEMGSGGDELPPPVTVGYIEPNIEFWNGCKELMLKNESFLTKYNLKTESLQNKTLEIKEILDFFITVSQKETNHQPLTVEEFNTIETLGGQFDYLSLNMLNAYINYQFWEEVKGPDKTIALIADVYTRNVPGCPNNGILHVGTGLGHVIHVIVEINGLLYLTRGATFSYYEFPYNERLTDEKWQELLLQNKSITPVDWMNQITVQ